MPKEKQRAKGGVSQYQKVMSLPYLFDTWYLGYLPVITVDMTGPDQSVRKARCDVVWTMDDGARGCESPHGLFILFFSFVFDGQLAKGHDEHGSNRSKIPC